MTQIRHAIGLCQVDERASETYIGILKVPECKLLDVEVGVVLANRVNLQLLDGDGRLVCVGDGLDGSLGRATSRLSSGFAGIEAGSHHWRLAILLGDGLGLS